MAADPELARLRWRCRRGMRELDRILERFLETAYGELPVAEKRRFAEILEYPDPDLHAYLVGRAEPSDPAVARLLHSIRVAMRV
jgi:antitoxin CptB